MSRTIMLVDGDEISRFVTHKMLKISGFSGGILHFDDIDEAISYLKESLPDVIIIDFFQHANDKFRMLETLEELDKDKITSTIVLWDLDEEFVKNLSVYYRIEEYYNKPLKLEEAAYIISLL